MHKPRTRHQAKDSHPSEKSALEIVRRIQKRIFWVLFMPFSVTAVITAFMGLEELPVILILGAFFFLVVCFIVELRYDSPGW